MKPMVIAAPNGARRLKADHPNLPLTIPEIAAEAERCQRAGAAILHLHVRDSQGAHSLDPGLYREAMDEVSRVAPSLLVQITTEAAGRFDLSDQIACVQALRPKAVSVAWREFAPEDNADARRFYAWAAETGLHIQHILYSPDEVARFTAYGLENQSVLLVLGTYAGTHANPGDLPAYLANLHGVHDFTTCAFGPREHAVSLAAIAAGGHARVGFENNLLLQDGSHAETTAALVAQFDMPLARPDDARRFWGIS
ncbi:MAG TPA: 3-keto-5-aminohexanoate cleavage protein [Aliiroseovarius sp.]|nr:3-keto-5-aminohexanoate cleavage protein [Aliiroseovarius sp.]